ncbi:Putative secreted protein [Ignavibacterium album JCM 16511]|uniref:Putative secreted protein n=1 Tax=Ignavibacterium album (strain DSM 19864 / JCM 16511 / NBRC 101810 / Mat9-16) TaxID=945713 RepID=I0AIT7_IGNAJ|nr:discoidin domain-containing protein [Ignavibacterium album]AFH48894.1 Putative secreted protein [Ignavibacterium album JCM 16511]
MKANSPTVYLLIIYLILIVHSQYSFAQKVLLGNFDNIESWKIYKSEGVEINILQVEGRSGKALRLEYDFTKGAGYGGIQKLVEIDLPENYQFSFYIRANSPNNNLEIKFLDASGENVWWMNNRNYTFPKDWTKFTVKKRHIEFAWGPTQDKSLKKINRIEFTIAAFTGGKGWIEFDDLYFETLPDENKEKPNPIITATSQLSNDFSAKHIADGKIDTKWLSVESDEEKILIDFQGYREIGGFIIDWDKENYPVEYEIYFSDGNEKWSKVYSVSSDRGERSYIRLLNAEGKFALIVLKKRAGKYFGINELRILEPSYTEDINQFFINLAKDYPRGFFPRYFYKEKSYWNIIGVKSDYKEALINEDGMIEVDKQRFSIEPMIMIDKKLLTWNDVKLNQTLENDYLPIPSVNWTSDKINLQIKSFASGKANETSVLYCIYQLTNTSKAAVDAKLFLLLRPFQVNPYYQWLNITGGASKINSIEINDNEIKVDSDKYIFPLTKFSSAGAIKFESGNIVSLLSEGIIPKEKKVVDNSNLASGVLSYDFNLKAGESKVIAIAIPFYEKYIDVKISNDESANIFLVESELQKVKSDWEKTLSHIKFNLPPSADKIINTFKSNLAYILINRDGPGIQPGSRSYERSWIRDGSLTSSALLKSGIKDEVREFIDWYSEYQFENGKVPCVVDKRGADPVPEHDSHGEYIFLLKQYFNFTKDTSLLRKHNQHIIKAVDYLKSLIDERSTDHFKNGNDSVRAYYGILPESISHEGYSAKPMHSYWDNFFALRGLKDATDIQSILGNQSEYQRIKNIRDKFRNDLYNSLSLAIKTRKINYIPGCVELGDFDATSTTIALYPVNEKINLPQPYLNNTFDKYFDFFRKRRDGKLKWNNYTPYENRIIGSFIMLDKPERAHELIKFFLNDQRPKGWNHWAEVVWKDYRYPGFIGDMPHTWVGSDFINAVRAMFVYENDYDSSLVIGSALYDEWINSKSGMSIENLPTFYGHISYSIRKEKNKYLVDVYGNINLPGGGIILKNFNSSRMPVKVLVNGKESKSFTKNSIPINEFPAKVEIFYH